MHQENGHRQQGWQQEQLLQESRDECMLQFMLGQQQAQRINSMRREQENQQARQQEDEMRQFVRYRNRR